MIRRKFQRQRELRQSIVKSSMLTKLDGSDSMNIRGWAQCEGHMRVPAYSRRSKGRPLVLWIPTGRQVMFDANHVQQLARDEIDDFSNAGRIQIKAGIRAG